MPGIVKQIDSAGSYNRDMTGVPGSCNGQPWVAEKSFISLANESIPNYKIV